MIAIMGIINPNTTPYIAARSETVISGGMATKSEIRYPIGMYNKKQPSNPIKIPGTENDKD